MKHQFILAIILIVYNTAYSQSNDAKLINYEKFTLENGLQVIFHIDRSDPVVDVSITAHVGSAREKIGRTGFAHLFEHLLFLESENLGKGGLDKLSARIGGAGANGFTSRDITNYHQTVPNDALEKMIWAEADKLGWFINTVTDPVLAKEKEVVKNEKRMSSDNSPYGHVSYLVGKNLYPEQHPYNWQVIGSLEDLNNATLDDVKEFYRTWYVPNNVTLILAGDFNVDQAKKWVHKYFEEIPRGTDVIDQEIPEVNLTANKFVYYEDNFAQVPELRMVWPTVPKYHEDYLALAFLVKYLSDGKSAPLYKTLVEKDKVSPGVFMWNNFAELDGESTILVRAFSESKLDDVYSSINKVLKNFSMEGISKTDIQRIRTSLEVEFYNDMSSVSGKARKLTYANALTGDPDIVNSGILDIGKVTVSDVKRVFNKYLKDKNHVAISTVPKGQTNQILTGSILGKIVVEEVIDGAENEIDASISAKYDPTPSKINRAIEPNYGPSPKFNQPVIWESNLDNGLTVLGIENNETPMVEMSLIFDEGQANESFPGISNLMTNLIQKGTKTKTPQEFENELKQLGSQIYYSAGKENNSIHVKSLSKNLEATLTLLIEQLSFPRWDTVELNLIKSQVISQLNQQKGNPVRIADLEFDKLTYGESELAKNLLGTVESIGSISIDDIIQFYESLDLTKMTVQVVGNTEKDMIDKSLGVLKVKASSHQPSRAQIRSNPPVSSKIYFYDVPGAKQSQLRIGLPSLNASHENFYSLKVANYILGGGGFASRLTQKLRESKGYTYSIRSQISTEINVGRFFISSPVRSNVTLESMAEIKELLEQYPTTFTEKDLSITQGYLIKSNARNFESLNSKLLYLQSISLYGWENEYPKNREEFVSNLTVDEIQKTAVTYMNPKKMYWLVVGDAASQMEKLKTLGFGDPILLNK